MINVTILVQQTAESKKWISRHRGPVLAQRQEVLPQFSSPHAIKGIRTAHRTTSNVSLTATSRKKMETED